MFSRLEVDQENEVDPKVQKELARKMARRFQVPGHAPKKSKTFSEIKLDSNLEIYKSHDDFESIAEKFSIPGDSTATLREKARKFILDTTHGRGWDKSFDEFEFNNGKGYILIMEMAVHVKDETKYIAAAVYALSFENSPTFFQQLFKKKMKTSQQEIKEIAAEGRRYLKTKVCRHMEK